MTGVVVLARLVIWQLDRLEQGKAFNAQVLEQQIQPALELTAETLGEDLYAMEYCPVKVMGVYDFENQVASSGKLALVMKNQQVSPAGF
jgi:cytochrome oxidase assembly protein ShyY1